MNDKELQQAFILFLAQKSGAKTQKDLEQYIQNLGEDGLKKAYEEFTSQMLQKTKKAAHGTKLNYFKKLKNQCAEDEEVVYFKKGGSVDCGCVKKASAGMPIKEKVQSVVNSFKKLFTSKKAEEKKDSTSSNKTIIISKKEMEERAKQLNRPVDDSQRQYEEGFGDHEVHPNNYKKKVKKNCGGSKLLIKKGGSVCPKCGKVHKAGMGCTIAKFKAYKNGGSLNGVPFIKVGQTKAE